MPDRGRVTSLDDILHDLEGTREAEDRIARFFAGEARSIRWRGGFRGGAPSGGGRGLLARSGEATRRRYETLLWFEEMMPPAQDHGYLIGPACQILEAELDRLLTAPARHIAGSLVAALRAARKDRDQAEVLAAWEAGRVPATIGIGSLVLLALRRGRDQRLAPVLEFLADRFEPGYEALLESKRLGQCLDVIRTRFRNPTCHGTATFDRAGYAEFVRLVVANRRFAAWDAAGPDPTDPDAGAGFLHHHLLRARPLAPPPAGAIDPSGRPDQADALARLLALRAPASSPLEIHFRPHAAAASRGLREITVTPARLALSFRLGDRIRFGFQANRPCHVAMIDVGTSGTVAVVWPNAWSQETRVEGGRPYFLPRIEAPEFDFILTGRAGRERVVAIATTAPLAVPLLPEPGTPFRVLAPAEIGRIADEVGRDPSGWAVAVCEFEVTE